MIVAKNKRESFVEKVNQPVDESIVCSSTDGDGLREQESEWSSKGDRK